MSKNRLEAFSDGVIAILITIMVLELRTPHGTTWAALPGSQNTLICAPSRFAGALAGRDGSPVVTEDAV